MAHRPEAEQLTTLVFYGTVIVLTWLAWQIVRPFIQEIAWAVVLAICVDPLRKRLAPRLGRTRTAIVVMAAVLVLIIVPCLVVGYVVVHEGSVAAGYLQAQLEIQGGAAGAFHHLWQSARARAPFLPDEQAVIEKVTTSVLTVAKYIGSRTGSVLASVARLVLSLVIVLALLFFLVRDAEPFVQGLRRILPFGPEHNQRVIDLASDLVSASVTSTLVIAGIQGVLGGLTFALLGVPGPAVWGVMIAILALLPLVGAALVWAPAAVLLAFTGHLLQGVVIAAVGVLVLGNVDNVVRPFLLSGKSQLNTLVLVISLMGGVSAFGFIGVALGPLVAALVSALVVSYSREVEPAATAVLASEPAADRR